VLLALLFGGQFLFTSTEVRYLFIAFYLLISVGLLAVDSQRRHLLWRLIVSDPLGKGP
jgi:hypothetical protein